MAKTQQQIQEGVTNRIIAALENGTKPWKKPWILDPNSGAAENVVSGNRYRGINTIMLNLTALDFGYLNKNWGTFKQWKALNGRVRKGEKATTIVFWKCIPKTGKNEDGTDREGNFFLLKHFSVFNYEQIEKVYPTSDILDKDGKQTVLKTKTHKLDKFAIDEKPPVFDHDTFEPAETLITESGAKITYGGNRACYSRSGDNILCPLKSNFPKLDDFYGTMFHELSHWAEIRTEFDKLDDKSYALGELVAEMSSCMISEELKVPTEQPKTDQSAAYIKSWLNALKSDPKWIFKAAKWAAKASELLMGSQAQERNEYTKAA